MIFKLLNPLPGGGLVLLAFKFHLSLASLLGPEVRLSCCLCLRLGLLNNLRPSSILLIGEEGLRVLDAMTACVSVPHECRIGSVPYLAPEFRLSETSQPRSDQFSLAVLAHHLLTGQIPFEAQTSGEQMLKILSGMWRSSESRSLSVRVRGVFDRSFSPAIDSRFHSCRELIWELEKAWTAQVSSATRVVNSRIVDSEPQSTGVPGPPVIADLTAYLGTPERSTPTYVWVCWCSAVLFALAACFGAIASAKAKQQLAAERLLLAEMNAQKIPGTATAMQNGTLTVCNPLDEPIKVLDITSTYWDPSHHLRTFNSSEVEHLAWQIPPNSTVPLFLGSGEKPQWDGASIFYSLRYSFRGKEYFSSGFWSKGHECVSLTD